MRTLFAMVCSLLLPLAALGASPTYFVAQDGDDAWTGTLPAPNADRSDGPVATLHRAQELLRTHATEAGLPEGGSIYVREGTYYLDKPINITQIESGTAESPTLWQPYQFEQVILVAGQPVHEWKDAGEGMLEVTVHVEPTDSVHLLHDGVRMPLARWPNQPPPTSANPVAVEAHAYVTGVSDTGALTYTAGSRAPASDTGGFIQLWIGKNRQESMPFLSVTTETVLLEPYKRLECVQGFACFYIKEVPGDGVHPYLRDLAVGSRFHLEGSPEFLDAPGEWYFDRENRRLRFLPPGELVGETIVATTDNFFHVDSARHVAVLGFTMIGATSEAVFLRNASDCLVARNTVVSSRGSGIMVLGGVRNRVAGNDIRDAGGAGIVLSGGSFETLAPAHHVAENNHIQHVGQIRKSFSPGISLDGVGLVARNNLIHDTPHMGIGYRGNDHLIEHNHLHHVCLETANTGAIYTYGSWVRRGTVIRHNRIHDVYGLGLWPRPGTEGALLYATPYQAWGIHLDGAASGTAIYGNQIYRVPLGGIMIAGGMDNVVENNLFVDTVPALHIDARWESFAWEGLEAQLDWALEQAVYLERYPVLAEQEERGPLRMPHGNQFMRNVIDYQRDDYRGLASTVPAPESAVIYNLDRFASAPADFDRNLVHHHGQSVRVLWNSAEEGLRILPWEAWRENGFDVESVVDVPRFLEPAADDYLMLPMSTAYKLGFERLPDVDTGLYQDEFRASWPPPVESRREGAEHRLIPVP